MKGKDLTSREEQLQQEQFTAYFRLYEYPLYCFALKSIQSELLARDIIQEVFIKLWSVRDQFSDIRNIEDYLYKMVRNKVLDVLRQLANDRRLRAAYFNDHQWEESRTYENIVAKEYEFALAEAINQLPPQRRIIYQLSQVEGRTRNEIAAELRISPSTVKNQLTAALSYLRKIVAGQIKLF
ncbi:RNA polymerase sigma-70 factor [Chitinophaga sp. CC14]|uniref:RNA polymerase sigma factor n=1 Tax=Chitinophaga sp. CC14 TaxID=3029199 RepID=UPI003B7F86A4